MELKLTQEDIEMAIEAYVRQQGLTLKVKSYSFIKTDSLTCSIGLEDKRINFRSGLPLPKDLEPFKNIIAERPYNRPTVSDYPEGVKVGFDTLKAEGVS